MGDMTDFRRLGEPGVIPNAGIAIAAHDERAIGRVRRRVWTVVRPFLPRLTVSVSSDPRPESRT